MRIVLGMLTFILLFNLVILSFPPLGTDPDEYFNDRAKGDVNTRTIVVDVAGNGDHTSIRSAVSNASEGDTIEVRSGIYEENVVIDRRVDLVGAGPEKCTIVGNGSADVIAINADGCLISGFKITGSGQNAKPDHHAGIQMKSKNNRVENCNCTGNRNGVVSSILYDNNVIVNTTCCFNSDRGIFIMVPSVGSAIIDCVCFENQIGICIEERLHDFGMYRIRPAHGHEVTGCTCYDNEEGIYVSHIAEVNISGCVCTGNGNGITLHSDWEKNVDDCTLNRNTVGLYLKYGSNCALTNTTLVGNEYGISGHDASKNDIINCVIDSNTYGVRITSAVGNTFDNCSCSRNEIGMEFVNDERTHWDDEGVPYTKYHGSNENVFSNNIFEENRGYALKFSVHCTKNKIHYNDFIHNNRGGVQAFDNGTDNEWNQSDRGNYWSDWTSPDRDNNGIVDDPYPIEGGSQAKDHLPVTTPGKARGGGGGLTMYGWAILLTAGFLIFAVVILIISFGVFRCKTKIENDSKKKKDQDK